MSQPILPQIPKTQWDQLFTEQNSEALYELVTIPLHEQLYSRQSFDLLDELPLMQQMLLAYDYVLTQVSQGGFIQFIQNKYISLLLPVIEGLKAIGEKEMTALLDNVLKVYVLNREALEADTTPAEFAALYQEFREFEALDARFLSLRAPTMKGILSYAQEHPEQFAILT
jgi:hypothetical protein